MLKLPNSEAYFNENELVEKHALSHVCNRNRGEHDQGSNHEALGPSFEYQSIRICRSTDL